MKAIEPKSLDDLLNTLVQWKIKVLRNNGSLIIPNGERAQVRVRCGRKKNGTRLRVLSRKPINLDIFQTKLCPEGIKIMPSK